jgi:hypothetical protein
VDVDARKKKLVFIVNGGPCPWDGRRYAKRIVAKTGLLQPLCGNYYGARYCAGAQILIYSSIQVLVTEEAPLQDSIIEVQ